MKKAIVHYDLDGIRCGAENVFPYDCTSVKERVTCPECLEFLKEDEIDDKLDEACEAYDRYMELRNELIEMDEMAADRLSQYVENHEG